MGPASIFVTVNSTETPVTSSPASRDLCTGLAPLHSGSKDGCTFSVPNLGALKNLFGKYCPYAAVMH
eukprot:3005767-Prorocentrum_lima.AAC.1